MNPVKINIDQIAAVQPEADFIAANHHPSCTLNDQDLMWVCAQCGLKVSAEGFIKSAIEKWRQSEENLLREIAQESAVEGRHRKFVTLQITPSTYDKLQAWYANLRSSAKHDS